MAYSAKHMTVTAAARATAQSTTSWVEADQVDYGATYGHKHAQINH